MAVILENKPVLSGFSLLTLPFPRECAPGQFVMLRVPGGYDPFLPRPISVYDWAEGKLTLLYQAVGRGTTAMAALLPGQEIEVTGPLGHGFPLLDADYVLIGGGVGIAPLYYLAKAHRRLYPARKRTIHLGFRETPLLEEEYRAAAEELQINIGGFVTDDVDFTREDAVYCACGPTPMMAAAAKLAKAAGAALYVSLEERMACGVGACLGCSIPTTAGNRRVCKDGPVFPAEEVFFDEA